MKSTDIYRCPDDISTNASSYLVNSYVNLLNSAQIVSSATLLLATDGNNSGNNAKKLPSNTSTGNGLNEDYSLYCQTYRIANSDHSTPRHTNRDNFLFADGHVKSSPVIPDFPHPTPTQIESVIPFRTFINPDPQVAGLGHSWQ